MWSISAAYVSVTLPWSIVSLYIYFCFLFAIFQTNCDINYSLVILVILITAWSINMYDSVAEVFSILATTRSCGIVHCSYQHYQPGKKTLHFFSADDWIFSCFATWIMDDVIRARFCGFNDYCSGNFHWEKWYI